MNGDLINKKMDRIILALQRLEEKVDSLDNKNREALDKYMELTAPISMSFTSFRKEDLEDADIEKVVSELESHWEAQKDQQTT